jgi:hypothetical protein
MEQYGNKAYIVNTLVEYKQCYGQKKKAVKICHTKRPPIINYERSEYFYDSLLP